MKINKLITKIFGVISLFAISATLTFAAEPNMTTPHQYPKKYTPEYIKQITPGYKDVGKDEVFYVALDMLKDTEGMFSRNAILGNNLSGKPVRIEFRNLSEINAEYATFDALGWKKVKNYTSISIQNTKTLQLVLLPHYLHTKHFTKTNTTL